MLGRELNKGDNSRSGLYAIVSSKGIILRVSLFQEVAEMLCDYSSRYIHEVFISKTEPIV